MEQVQTQDIPGASEARTTESQTLPEELTVARETDEPKMVITNKDGDDGGPVMDDGVDQLVDLHEDNQIKDQYGGLDERGGSVGYVGDPAQGAAGIPEIPDMIPDLGIDGAGPPDIEIPDLGLPGLDQESELADLAESAAFGADGRVSAGDGLGEPP